MRYGGEGERCMGSLGVGMVPFFIFSSIFFFFFSFFLSLFLSFLLLPYPLAHGSPSLFSF
jgi:hypothetical protein